MIKVIAFDLDKTLTESKAPLDPEMAELLCRLLASVKIIIVSGASLRQFEKQFLSGFNCREDRLGNLSLLPLNGAAFYIYPHTPKGVGVYRGKWQAVYRRELSPDEKKKINLAFEKAFEETGFTPPADITGVLLEDRGAQITFSALGSEAPLFKKEKWDPDLSKRKRIAASLRDRLSDFSVSIGGSTSIDVTRRGIDKAYGLRQAMNFLHVHPSQVIYVGDALFAGGNDSAVISLGLRVVSVDAPGIGDTKELIRKWLEGGVK